MNTALEKIPGIEMDNNLKQRLLAEARILRAFYYFHLRIYFNKPPLVLQVISSFSESKLPNATAAEIRAQIETDLLEAIVVLPETYDSDGRTYKAENSSESVFEIQNNEDPDRWSLLPDPWVDPDSMVSGYVAGKNEYLPIPIVEITMSEGLLEQNPGW